MMDGLREMGVGAGAGAGTKGQHFWIVFFFRRGCANSTPLLFLHDRMRHSICLGDLFVNE